MGINDLIQSWGQGMPERLDIAKRRIGQDFMQDMLAKRDAERQAKLFSPPPFYPTIQEIAERSLPLEPLIVPKIDLGAILANINSPIGIARAAMNSWSDHPQEEEIRAVLADYDSGVDQEDDAKAVYDRSVERLRTIRPKLTEYQITNSLRYIDLTR
ncbi:hypothetical protein KA107_03260 [Candidatus Pacearchaeota archaeon]|nr:hypothetical protein [Candidatus Pacearchaeota archaeon]